MSPALQRLLAAPALRRTLSLAAVLLAALTGAAGAAEPPRVALVLANGRVTAAGVAPLPACPASARAVGRRLTELNFDLVQSIDAGRGETEVAIAGFAGRLRNAPEARAVVYICGTFSELGGRAFLLPASAVLERSSDLLTQGVLLRGLPDILAQAGIGAGLIALDTFAPDGRAHLPPLPALPDGAVALVASSQADRLRQPTALAQALLRELQEPAAGGGDLGSIAARLQAGLADPPGGGQALGLAPARAAMLLEGAMPGAAEAPQAPQPPLAEAPPTSPPVVIPATPPPPAPVAGAPPGGSEAVAQPPEPLAPPGPTPPAFVGEPPLSEADRRGIQTTLTMLGYYRERVDGTFGPGTRAAIRRYQAEIGAAPSGALTAGQARRLLTAAGSRRP
jgi:hypothetical protein